MKNRAILTLAISLFALPVQAEQTLILNSSYYAPITSETHDGVLDLVYQELSRRLGIKIEIQNLAAAERVLLNVNEGIVDGDVGRVAGLEKKYPNMISVPVAVSRYEMVAFSRDVDFKVSGSESIKPYNIGIVRGWKILELASAGAKSLTALESGEQLFGMLDATRIDLALLDKLQGLHFIKTLNLKGIKVLKPNLLEGQWYLYLNKKHEALIPRITAELRKMEQEGVIKHIYDSVLARYIRVDNVK